MREKILILDNKGNSKDPLNSMLMKAGYAVCSAGNFAGGAKAILEEEQPDCVLIDIISNGLNDCLNWARCLTKFNIPYLYLAGDGDGTVLEAIDNSDPYGFLFKPLRENDVLLTLALARQQYKRNRQAGSEDNIPDEMVSEVAASLVTEEDLSDETDREDRDASQPRAKPDHRAIFPEIIGDSEQIHKVLDQVMQVAAYNCTVLIQGETGVGKEGLASAIHRQSPRRSKPFIKINCAAIPHHLIESELFGHERGSFTGATDRKIGKFELANGGSLFLDEIGEMPLSLQSKLLRVLQEKEIERIGGRSTIKIDVRIIAATNCNLEEDVKTGKFRNDLFFRLNVFPITVPPLRQHKGDIPLLADHFLKKHAVKMGRSVTRISNEVIKKLTAYDWPGNIRELEHLIERNILITTDRVINNVVLPASAERIAPSTDSRIRTIDEVEREHIMFVLNECNGKVAGSGGAAEQLQLPSTTLNSKIKRLGVKKEY